METSEGGDLDDPQPFGHRDDRGVRRSEREVGVGVDQLGHAVVVGHLEINHRQGPLHDRPQERSLDPSTTSAPEQIADLGDGRSRYEDLTARQMQTGQ